MRIAQLVRKGACVSHKAWARNTASAITVSMQRALAATPRSAAITWCTCFRQRRQAQLQFPCCPRKQSFQPWYTQASLLMRGSAGPQRPKSVTGGAGQNTWAKYGMVSSALAPSCASTITFDHSSAALRATVTIKTAATGSARPPKKHSGLHVMLTTPMKKKPKEDRKARDCARFIANGPALACRVRTRCAPGGRTHARVHQSRTGAPPTPFVAQGPRAIGVLVSAPPLPRPRKR